MALILFLSAFADRGEDLADRDGSVLVATGAASRKEAFGYRKRTWGGLHALHRQTTQAVVAVALLVSVAGPADALESAGQLLGACERFLQVVDLSGPRFDIPREEPEAIMCWAFMRAVQDLSTVSFAGKRALYACPPEQTFVSQLIRVFVSY